MRRNSSTWDIIMPLSRRKRDSEFPTCQSWGIKPSLPLQLKGLLQSRTVPGLCLLEKTLQKDIQLVLGWQHPQHRRDFAQQISNSFVSQVFTVPYFLVYTLSWIGMAEISDQRMNLIINLNWNFNIRNNSSIPYGSN